MIVFVTGIDTAIGKSVVTGLLASWLQQQGRRVITHKLVQTGCQITSEDILLHRQLMGVRSLPEDAQQLTCGAVYSFPASPHLAAELDGAVVDIEHAVECTRRLEGSYDVVLVEGAGGLFVPLTRQTTTIDVVAQERWPVVLVTAPRLGSINHTLLSLEALERREIPLAAVVYNRHFPAAREIEADTRIIIQEYLARMDHDAPIIDLPRDIALDGSAVWDDPGLQSLLKNLTETRRHNAAEPQPRPGKSPRRHEEHEGQTNMKKGRLKKEN